MNDYNLVACCSTLPERVRNGGLYRSVRSMLDQTFPPDHIFIHYPRYSKRLHQDYPAVPSPLKHMRNVTVVRSEDFGPLTKIYPVTDQPRVGPHTAVALFDDDRIYPKDWLKPVYEEFQRHGRTAAVGRNGILPVKGMSLKHRFNTSPKPLRVSVLGASWVSIYPRFALPADTRTCIDSLHSLPKAAYTNDDVVLGVWVHKSRVRAYVMRTTDAEFKEWQRVNDEDDQLVHQISVNSQRGKLRMLTHDASALTTPAQKRRQFRLVTTLIAQNKLPCPVWCVVSVSGIVALLMLVILLPVVYATKRKRGSP